MAVRSISHLQPLAEESESRSLDPEERRRQVEAFLPAIKYQALRMAARIPCPVDVEELMHAGILGLLEAMEKYNPERGIQLKTYAEFRIRGAILDELRSMDWASRTMRDKIKRLEEAYSELEQRLQRPPEEEEIAQYLGLTMEEFHALLGEVRGGGLMSLEDLLGGEGKDEGGLSVLSVTEGPYDACALSELRRKIREALEELTDREQLVITLYYYEELTMKEIGMALGVTESRVSQIHSAAIMKLRAKLRDLQEVT